jgi:hypothetical protein
MPLGHPGLFEGVTLQTDLAPKSANPMKALRRVRHDLLTRFLRVYFTAYSAAVGPPGPCQLICNKTPPLDQGVT